MSPEDLLREGETDQALIELKKIIQKNPAEPKHRIFLFQLLSVFGKWESALHQLQILGELDASALGLAALYSSAVRCEQLRSQVFSQGVKPTIFGEPQRWLALMCHAIELDAHSQHAQAAKLRHEALELAPASSGEILTRDQKHCRFQWLCDADRRFGPVIEAIIQGKFYLVPMERIQNITFEPPTDLRDLIWSKAVFTWINGGQLPALIPVRYPGSETSLDSKVQLAATTLWATGATVESNDPSQIGLGQRLYATDQEDIPILQIQRIQFQSVTSSADQQTPNP